MEDILDVYCLAYDPARPLVCMDEQPVQLLKETRAPEPAAPGRLTRYDYEYERNGTANIFLFAEPLGAWRHLEVTGHRTKLDWARQIKWLLDDQYPDVEMVRLVMDNLNTHGVGSLYAAFPPEEARRLAQRLEIHYTPKHGSWLNVAECELSILSRQCLDRRIPDVASLKREVAAWTEDRNNTAKPLDWRFTIEDARIKMRRLYPSVRT
jgi:hypothetical protein